MHAKLCRSKRYFDLVFRLKIQFKLNFEIFFILDCDRFIPTRSSMNFDVSKYMVMSQNTSSPAQYS